jgi:hypothetical protein
MASQSLALIDVLADIPDFRQSQGRRYSLVAVLSLMVAALLCGYKSYSAIAEWGRHYGLGLVQALGFATGKTPCAATLHAILSQVDKTLLENRLARWIEALLQAHRWQKLARLEKARSAQCPLVVGPIAASRFNPPATSRRGQNQ